MKRTTYILIGLFIAGLIVLVGGMFVLVFTGKPYDSNSITLGGDQVAKEIPPCKVLWITQKVLEKDGRMLWLRNSSLGVSSSSEKKNVFSCPKEVNDYLTMNVSGDTLKIVFDYPMDQIMDKFKERQYMDMIIGSWQLQISPEVETIIYDVNNQELALNAISKDSLSISTSASVTMDECNFQNFTVLRSGRNLNLRSGNIHNLHLFLDYMDDWNVNTGACHIDTEYLRGNRANVKLGKGECKRMFWIPEKEDSELQVTLTEKSCVTVME